MIDAIIVFALRQRILVAILFVLLLGLGVAAFTKLNIEAYPDPVPPLVEVITQSSGQSAEEMERYVTIPLEIQLAGLPHVTAIRTISLFGLSDVKVQFTYELSFDEAQQKVLNALSQLPPFPNGVQPQLSPTSPIGEIYRYRLSGPAGFSVTDLKTLQDWVLQRRFKAVPGVIDVTGWGGKTKTYDVTVDLNRLVSYALTLPQVLQALGNADINVGGQTVNIGAQSAVVRGIGLITSMQAMRETVITQTNGTPVLLGDVAEVSVGNQPRLGIAGQDESDDIVQGIILMRRGAESMPTIEKVEAEVEKINNGNILPPGVHLERIYDRSGLIGVTTHTVLHNMVVGVLLIFAVQWLFLGNLRSAVIVSATIPFALFFAIMIMVLRGESANLLSVGAIDFGLIVDATVIMVENIFRHLIHGWKIRPEEGAMRVHGAPRDLRGRFGLVFAGATEVSRGIFFSAAIIVAGFVPLFTLGGIEGHIFGPMAKTYAYALAGGLLATFTVAPALSALLLTKDMEEKETFLVKRMRLLYLPLLNASLGNKIVTLGAAGVLILGVVLCSRFMGLEFLPKLEEGNLWIRATLPTTISLEEGNVYVNRMRALLKSFPEMETVVSQHGRPDDGTDSTGFFNAEFFVPLKPQSSWPGGIDKEELTRQVMQKLANEFPGVDFNASQYIQDNVEEAASGVKGENSVKLYGNDLAGLEKSAEKIKAVLEKVPGITDLAIFTELGQPTIKIDIDRARAARYGLASGDVNAVVQAAIGGQSPGDLYEEGSDRHFPMVVRLAPQYRDSIDAIRSIPVGVTGPNGIAQVPLSDVAKIDLVSGASFIYREQGQRYIPIKFSVRGRDLGGAVQEAQQKIAASVPLPTGYRLEWVGEFGNLEEAIDRLSVAVPFSIALICLLLYLNFSSVIDMLLAVSVIPLALIGGVFGLFFTGTPFSVSAAIGFITLFGISAMDGILVLSYYNLMLMAGKDRLEALLLSCATQFRPVMMTCIAACVGLLPAAISSGIGSQVQKPLALVVVCGVLLAPVLILLVLPVLIIMFSSRRSSQLDTESVVHLPAGQ